MIEVLKEGWGELRSLLPDPTAHEVYTFLEQIARLQGLFKPGWLEVRDCEVVSLEGGSEEYHGILQARQRTASGHLSSTDAVIVRATFKHTPASRDRNARYECTHLSIGLVRLTDGSVKDRGRGYDITYSAFESTQGLGRFSVRIRDFPNGWRRTLRSTVLAKLLAWQLERCQRELKEARAALEAQANELQQARDARALEPGNNT